MQGIGQCRNYLAERYPGIDIVPVNSTAQAAREASDDVEGLAICSLKCAEVYDLDIVDRDIQDAGASAYLRSSRFLKGLSLTDGALCRSLAANTTRFVVLAPSAVPLPLSYPASRPSKLDEQPEQ